jgi:hypothetical protein
LQTQVLTYPENKEFCEELIVYFPFTWHEPNIKRRVQQFFYCCMCIRFRGNVLQGRCLAKSGCCVVTELLLSNDRRGHTYRYTKSKVSHKPTFIFSLFSLFWKHNRRLIKSPCCLSVYPSESVHLSMYPLLVFWGIMRLMRSFWVCVSP